MFAVFAETVALPIELQALNTQFQYAEQDTTAYQKRIVLLQLITILWMCAEAVIAIFAAIRARSVALLGFGADSGIELASAFVVFLRFKKHASVSETVAARITSGLLFVLAAFIVASSIVALINPRFRPEPTYLGIALLIAAAVAMPWLAHQKRLLATKVGSGSLKADATQSSMCAYLAWIALAGLVLNALFRFSWADPAAALLLLPIIIREGWDAMHGEHCDDCAM